MEAEARGFKFQGPRMKTNNGELNGRNMGNGVETLGLLGVTYGDYGRNIILR